MVCRLSVRDSEPHRNAVQESHAAGCHAFTGEIVADKKHQLVLPGPHLRTCEQGLVGSTIGVGAHGFEPLALPAFERPYLDLHPFGRAAMGGIQNVCAYFCGCRAQLKISCNRKYAILNTSSSAVSIS